jgi:hypothetical protein
VLTAVGLVAAGASLAGAQTGDTMVVDSGRSGFTLGVGLGLGHLGCADDDCDPVNEAAGINFHAGAMVSPRLAVIADVWGMAHRDDRVTLSQTIVTGALRFWPVRRLWISGGVGVARASFRYDADFVDLEDRTDSVLGYMGAVGFEALASTTFALDVALRAGTGAYDEDTRIRNVAVTVGANWY